MTERYGFKMVAHSGNCPRFNEWMTVYARPTFLDKFQQAFFAALPRLGYLPRSDLIPQRDQPRVGLVGRQSDPVLGKLPQGACGREVEHEAGRFKDLLCVPKT